MELAIVLALVVGYAWSVWWLYEQRHHDPRRCDAGERRWSNDTALRGMLREPRSEDRHQRYARP